MHKKLNDFHKKIIKLKGFNPQTKANENTKKCDYAKLRLTDDYEYGSEKEGKKMIKSLIRKSHLKTNRKQCERT